MFGILSLEFEAIEMMPRIIERTQETLQKFARLDLADLNEHVGIKRINGFFKQLRFTPENPKEFVAKVKELFK